MEHLCNKHPMKPRVVRVSDGNGGVDWPSHPRTGVGAWVYWKRGKLRNRRDRRERSMQRALEQARSVWSVRNAQELARSVWSIWNAWELDGMVR